MATEATSPRELELARKEKEAEIENAAKTGVGTRTHVGQTRGKNPIVISWQAFDDSKPETLPTSIETFLKTVELDPTKDEKVIVDYLIRGYNDAAYTAASDPLAEFVDLAWPPEAQTQFRLVVRNYSRGADVSLDEAVTLIKPGFVKQFSKKPAATEPAAV